MIFHIYVHDFFYSGPLTKAHSTVQFFNSTTQMRLSLPLIRHIRHRKPSLACSQAGYVRMAHLATTAVAFACTDHPGGFELLGLFHWLVHCPYHRRCGQRACCQVVRVQHPDGILTSLRILSPLLFDPHFSAVSYLLFLVDLLPHFDIFSPFAILCFDIFSCVNSTP